jgi:hypothetical protein
MEWEWTRNEPGMTQENLMKILKFSNSGSFLGFLGILRNPEDSTRNWWGRVKTSKKGYFLCQIQSKTTVGKSIIGKIKRKLELDKENHREGHPSKLSW